VCVTVADRVGVEDGVLVSVAVSVVVLVVVFVGTGDEVQDGVAEETNGKSGEGVPLGISVPGEVNKAAQVPFFPGCFSSIPSR